MGASRRWRRRTAIGVDAVDRGEALALAHRAIWHGVGSCARARERALGSQTADAGRQSGDPLFERALVLLSGAGFRAVGSPISLNREPRIVNPEAVDSRRDSPCPIHKTA